MPRPLTQKICGFCAKSYTTRVDKMPGCLCPNCAKDRNVMKYHVDFQQDFSVIVHNNLYKPVYWGRYSRANLMVGAIIGYTSEATDIFFIGRIRQVGILELQVSPIKRLTQTLLNRILHDVPYNSVRCSFKFHHVE